MIVLNRTAYRFWTSRWHLLTTLQNMQSNRCNRQGTSLLGIRPNNLTKITTLMNNYRTFTQTSNLSTKTWLRTPTKSKFTRSWWKPSPNKLSILRLIRLWHNYYSSFKWISARNSLMKFVKSVSRLWQASFVNLFKVCVQMIVTNGSLLWMSRIQMTKCSKSF